MQIPHMLTCNNTSMHVLYFNYIKYNKTMYVLLNNYKTMSTLSSLNAQIFALNKFNLIFVLLTFCLNHSNNKR